MATTQPTQLELFGQVPAVAGRKQRLSERTVERISLLYLGGMTQREVADELGIHLTTVKNHLISSGTPKRGPYDMHRTYPIDHQFFDQIDTERKAWVLGFTVTDGCLIEVNNSLSFNLERACAYLLEDIRHCLGATNPVRLGSYFREDKEHLTSHLLLTSRPMYDALVRLGVTPRKSLTVRPPAVPPELEHHFWRGCICGDGCIHHRKNGYWNVHFIGSYWMVEGFIGFIHRRIPGAKLKAPIPHGNVFQISYGGIGLPQDIIRLLYGESVIHHRRKHALAQELMAETPRTQNRSNRDWSWLTKDVLAELKKDGMTWNDVARQIGINPGNLSVHRYKLDGIKRRRNRKPRKAG